MSRIVANGLKQGSDENKMKTAFHEQMHVEAIGFQRYLDYLSAIVTIAPLLGCWGRLRA